jgi:hypothetical protein
MFVSLTWRDTVIIKDPIRKLLARWQVSSDQIPACNIKAKQYMLNLKARAVNSRR